jgi:hypothetical protein
MAIKPKPKPNYKNKSDISWVDLGKEYCAGASVYSLAKKYKVSRNSIEKQIQKNQWIQDVTSIINKEVAHKVAGLGNTLTSEQKQDAIDTESTRKADIAKEHIKEIADSRKIGSRLQSLVSFKVNELTAAAKANALDTKELDAVVKIYKNNQEALVAAQTREAIANGIDLMPTSKTEITVGDDAFANLIQMAAKSKASK